MWVPGLHLTVWHRVSRFYVNTEDLDSYLILLSTFPLSLQTTPLPWTLLLPDTFGKCLSFSCVVYGASWSTLTAASYLVIPPSLLDCMPSNSKKRNADIYLGCRRHCSFWNGISEWNQVGLSGSGMVLSVSGAVPPCPRE